MAELLADVHHPDTVVRGPIMEMPVTVVSMAESCQLKAGIDVELPEDGAEGRRVVNRNVQGLGPGGEPFKPLPPHPPHSPADGQEILLSAFRVVRSVRLVGRRAHLSRWACSTLSACFLARR
ncbi:MAG: hypothetical protein ACK56F_18385 [bacterium]